MTPKQYAAERGVSAQRVQAMLRQIERLENNPTDVNKARLIDKWWALKNIGLGAEVKSITVEKFGAYRILTVEYY